MFQISCFKKQFELWHISYQKVLKYILAVHQKLSWIHFLLQYNILKMNTIWNIPELASILNVHDSPNKIPTVPIMSIVLYQYVNRREISPFLYLFAVKYSKNEVCSLKSLKIHTKLNPFSSHDFSQFFNNRQWVIANYIILVITDNVITDIYTRKQ